MALPVWFQLLIASATPSVLLAISLWLARNLIGRWLVHRVEHSFDIKLETLRADLRKQEATLTADLSRKDNEIASIRNTALEVMSGRQIALNERRMQAVDELWGSFNRLQNARGITSLMSITKYENSAKLAADDPRARAIFSSFKEGTHSMGLDKLVTDDAQKARPFVSPMVWAMYSAYAAIVALAVARLEIIVSGVGMPDIVNEDGVIKIVKAALPHREAYIANHGATGLYNLLDEIEEKLIEEIRKMLSGDETDEEGIKRAGEILRLSNEISASAQLNEAQLQANRAH